MACARPVPYVDLRHLRSVIPTTSLIATCRMSRNLPLPCALPPFRFLPPRFVFLHCPCAFPFASSPLSHDESVPPPPQAVWSERALPEVRALSRSSSVMEASCTGRRRTLSALRSFAWCRSTLTTLCVHRMFRNPYVERHIFGKKGPEYGERVFKEIQ